MTYRHIPACNLSTKGEQPRKSPCRTARRFASLTVHCFAWSIAIPFRFWDGTDPTTWGTNRRPRAPQQIREDTSGGAS